MLIKLSEYMKPSKALSRPHKGVVVDNEDPKKLRRVRVYIAGLLEGDTDNLPWVTPFNGGPNSVDIPKIDAELIIQFPYNDIYSPFYEGEFHSELNHNDYFDDGYPHTFGFAKDTIKAKYNDDTGEGEVIQLDGMEAKLSGDGSVELKLTDLILLLGGKFEVTASGEIKLVSDADVTIEGSNISATTGGNAEFKGDGGTTVGSGASATNVDGSAVNLAGGGPGVARLGDPAVGIGYSGVKVSSTIVAGSSKVFAG